MAVLCAVAVVLLLPASAFASVGMCDETGQSIAAPFPIMPLKSGELRAIDCDHERPETLGKVPATPAERVAANAELAPRYAHTDAARLGRQAATRLPIPAAVRGEETPGWRRGVYRPPRG